MTLLAVGTVALGLLFAWFFGGVLLRLGGLVLALAALAVLALTGEANAIVVFAIGTALWLAGHWHYALRHGDYKSPLAAFLFCRCAPAWLDPTRDRRTI
jgi:hypothetical protein